MPQGVPTEEEREELIKRLVSQFEDRLRKDLVIGPQTFDDIERQAQNIGEGVKEDITKEVVDECGSGYSGTRMMCECGKRARFVGMRGRSVISLHGVVPIERAYYYCEACRSSHCPLDQMLRLPERQCSRSVQVLIARFCSFLPFEKAAGELEIICGIRLSATTMQHYAKRIGEKLRAHWDTKEQQLYSGSASPSTERPKRLHASMDGTIIHVGGEWREAKLGVFYQRSERGGVCKARYYATLEPSWCFGRKMRTLGHQSGTDRCRDVAIVADGAPWIWQEAGKYFPQKVQILDFYHATEHLWQVAHARFGEGTIASQSWMSP